MRGDCADSHTAHMPEHTLGENKLSEQNWGRTVKVKDTQSHNTPPTCFTTLFQVKGSVWASVSPSAQWVVSRPTPQFGMG